MYSLSEFHNFSATWQNEFRSSFSCNFNTLPVPNIKFPGLDVFPVITIDDLNAVTLGPDGPSGSIQNLLQLQDNMSLIRGNHTIKFGYHFTDVTLTNYFIQRVLGNYEYSTLQQYLQDLTPDVLGERSAGLTSDPLGFLENEAFVNDDWKIRPNLTVNLGVRYEYATMPIASRYQTLSYPASVPGVFTVPNPQFSKNNWAPRVGFAYSPGTNGDLSIRGGFAMAYDNTYANLNANSAPPFFQQTNDVNLGANAPGFLAGGGFLAIRYRCPPTRLVHSPPWARSLTAANGLTVLPMTSAFRRFSTRTIPLRLATSVPEGSTCGRKLAPISIHLSLRATTSQRISACPPSRRSLPNQRL